MQLVRRYPKISWQPEEVLARQLAATRQMWAALQQHGVNEETEVTLEFYYQAASRQDAEQLARFLRQATVNDVVLEDHAVSGTTQPIPIDAPFLDQWVEWMVYAGAEHGNCLFNGWRTSAVLCQLAPEMT